MYPKIRATELPLSCSGDGEVVPLLWGTQVTTRGMLCYECGRQGRSTRARPGRAHRFTTSWGIRDWWWGGRGKLAHLCPAQNVRLGPQPFKGAVRVTGAGRGRWLVGTGGRSPRASACSCGEADGGCAAGAVWLGVPGFARGVDRRLAGVGRLAEFGRLCSRELLGRSFRGLNGV